MSHSAYLQNRRVFECAECKVTIVTDDTKKDAPIVVECAICGRNVTRSHIVSVMIVRDLWKDPATPAPSLINHLARYQYPNANAHLPLACEDNTDICQLCGCHVSNHELQ